MITFYKNRRPVLAAGLVILSIVILFLTSSRRATQAAQAPAKPKAATKTSNPKTAAKNVPPRSGVIQTYRNIGKAYYLSLIHI